MKVLICCDKFKGSLGANEVCRAIAAGINKSTANLECVLLPLADGGDGTGVVLKQVLGLNEKTIPTIDPLGRSIEAKYYYSQDTAFIELAEASGMWRLQTSELNVLETTTLGTGVLMQDAINSGFKKIVLSLGGSSTNDVGLGIAHSLGYKFLDSKGVELIPNGSNLTAITKIIEPSQSVDVSLRILCDVSNPLFGPNGAAQVFAGQKGADELAIDLLDKGMQHIAQIIQTTKGREIASFDGSGAAGGIAAGLFGLLKNVEVENGFQYLSELLNLSHTIANSDLVITGEGRLDHQSLHGKVVGEVAKLCQIHRKELMVVAGSNHLKEEDLLDIGVSKCYALELKASSMHDSIENATKYLEAVGAELIKPLL